MKKLKFAAGPDDHDLQTAYVLGAVRGGFIMSPGYYSGDGEWTNHDNAKLYHTRRAMRSGLAEAKKCLPEGADEVHAFGVWVT